MTVLDTRALVGLDLEVEEASVNLDQEIWEESFRCDGLTGRFDGDTGSQSFDYEQELQDYEYLQMKYTSYFAPRYCV